MLRYQHLSAKSDKQVRERKRKVLNKESSLKIFKEGFHTLARNRLS